MNIQQAIKTVKPAAKKGGLIALQTEGGELRLTAVNPAFSITAIADTDTDITCAIDADMFANAVQKFGDGATIDHADNKLTIKQGRSRVSIDSRPVDDVPLMDDDIGDSAMIAGDRLEAIGRVLFAAGVDDVRPYFNGVFVSINEGNTDIVATNGHVMAYQSFKGDSEGKSVNAIIGRDAVSALLSIADKCYIGNKVRGKNDDAIITINPINAKFPDWDRAIPGFQSKLMFIREDMLTAIDRVMVTMKEKFIGALMTIRDGEIVIESTKGDAQAAIDCQGGADMQIGINARYVRDAVAGMPDGSTVTLEYTDPTTATRFTDGELYVVVMPMRV